MLGALPTGCVRQAGAFYGRGSPEPPRPAGPLEVLPADCALPLSDSRFLVSTVLVEAADPPGAALARSGLESERFALPPLLGVPARAGEGGASAGLRLGAAWLAEPDPPLCW